MPSKPELNAYRPCVGLLVLNRQGRIWIGRRIEAGAISIEDAGMTSFVHDAEKDSTGESGIGSVTVNLYADADENGCTIGDHCLICPGVRIGSAKRIVIEDNCMLAGRVYVTDCDWHGLYDRLAMGRSETVRIGPNAWIGDSAIVCKGVKVGENSIVGAGAVVVGNVPPNTVAAGNPARVVKELDPQRPITTRAQWFADPQDLFERIDRLDRANLSQNSLLNWIRHFLFPT